MSTVQLCLHIRADVDFVHGHVAEVAEQAHIGEVRVGDLEPGDVAVARCEAGAVGVDEACVLERAGVAKLGSHEASIVLQG